MVKIFILEFLQILRVQVASYWVFACRPFIALIWHRQRRHLSF